MRKVLIYKNPVVLIHVNMCPKLTDIREFVVDGE